jgi:undecaprenyl diphosphate synthase
MGKNKLPRHLGIMPDGHRRWARAAKLPLYKGHQAGATSLSTICFAAFELGIPYVSVLLLSEQDWQRPKAEISYLLKFISQSVHQQAEDCKRRGIRLVMVGSRTGLPSGVLALIDDAVATTADAKSYTLALCINYSGQEELVDATKKLLRFRTDPSSLTVRDIEQALYVPDLPPVDLVLGSASSYKTDGFMLWRAAFAQYVFIDKLWPDVTPRDLRLVLLHYFKSQKQHDSLVS